MKPAEHTLIFGEEELILNNRRSLYWKRLSTLILSDLHLGKAAHFRKNGIPVPVQSALSDLHQLDSLLQFYTPSEVIFVGDLVHAGANTEVALLQEFIARFRTVKFSLVKGNHDRLPDMKLHQLGIAGIYSTREMAGITLAHTPAPDPGGRCISGHIHPGIRLKMPAGGYMKFPCFRVTDKQVILPAFSGFTGLDTRNLPANTTCYALHEEGIFVLKP